VEKAKGEESTVKRGRGKGESVKGERESHFKCQLLPFAF